MRMNWALLAALLCYAAAPAATCDPIDPLSPLNEPEWTLAEPATMSRALASTSMTQQTMQIIDATAADNLPSTLTAVEVEPQSGLR